MKTIKKIILLIALFVTAHVAEAATYVSLIDGRLYTNNTVAVGATYPTNTLQLGVVLGAATNSHNMGVTTGVQVNTNQWPSLGFSPQGGFPNTLQGPYAQVQIGVYGELPATNATSTSITIRWAGSIDGTLWQSNYLQTVYVIPVNTKLQGLYLTNTQTGPLPYMCVQQIENPGVAFLTNLVIQVSGKPGL